MSTSYISYFSYLSNFVQNYVGCFHSETEITKVQVSVAMDHPQYCVLGKCKRCGIDNNYVVSRPSQTDQKSVNASAWLTAHDFDFVTGVQLHSSLTTQ